MNILKVLGIDLDYTILSCKSLLYKLMNRIQRIKGDESISYTEIDPARVKQSPSLLAKISKIFNPNAYHPIPDAIETINHLHRMGYEIQFISNRPNFAPLVSMTTSWLEDHDVEYDKLVLGCKNKAAYAEVCHLDMMIDDNIHTCKNLAKKVYLRFYLKVSYLMMAITLTKKTYCLHTSRFLPLGKLLKTK